MTLQHHSTALFCRLITSPSPIFRSGCPCRRTRYRQSSLCSLSGKINLTIDFIQHHISSTTFFRLSAKLFEYLHRAISRHIRRSDCKRYPAFPYHGSGKYIDGSRRIHAKFLTQAVKLPLEVFFHLYTECRLRHIAYLPALFRPSLQPRKEPTFCASTATLDAES